MKSRLVVRSLAIPTLLLLPLAAGAQAISIFGPHPEARKCFESARYAAEFGTTNSYARTACSNALSASRLRTKDRAATHVNRGILSMALHEYAHAMSDFDTALVLYPRYGAIHVNRGNVFFIQDGYESAIDEYTKALEAEMDEEEIAYLNRGMAHEILGHLDAAEADYRSALELTPKWGLAISKLARVLSKKN